MPGLLDFLPPAQGRNPLVSPVSPHNYDPIARAQAVPRLIAQGEDARSQQRLAPDWWERLRAFGYGGADPFNIPSSLAGLYSPEVRDAWRASQEAYPGMAATGSILGAGGIGGLLTRSLGGASAGAFGTAYPYVSDIADAVADQRAPGKKRRSKDDDE